MRWWYRQRGHFPQSEEDKIMAQLQVHPDLVAKIEELEDRNNAIKQIAEDVELVHELMKDLRNLVDQQQPSLDAITKNIENSKQKVEEGEKDLVKAAKHQSFCRIL